MFLAALAMINFVVFSCVTIAASMQIHVPGESLLQVSEHESDFWECPQVHDRVPKSGIVLKHFPKCGGGSVVRLLEASVGKRGEAFATVHERQQLQMSDVAGDSFVIGLVRNPFERYVSSWSWQSRKKSQLRQSLSGRAARKLLGEDTIVGETREDRGRFREYMRRLGFHNSSTPSIGHYSLTFFLAYMAVNTDLPSYDCKLGLEQGLNFDAGDSLNLRVADKAGTNSDFNMQEFYEQHAALLQEASAGMSNLTTSSLKEVPVSCWIRTEHLFNDTRSCLVKYEDHRPHGARVHWAAFEQAVTSLPRVHAVEHVSCDQFYDTQLRETVLRRDGAILRAFGYPEGCNL